MTDNCLFNAFQNCECADKCISKHIHAPLIKPSTKGLYAIMAFGIFVSLFVYGGMQLENHYRALDLKTQENRR